MVNDKIDLPENPENVEQIISINRVQAKKIAYLFLKGLKDLEGWEEAKVGEAYPLFDGIDKKKAAYYEIKVSTSKREHSGSIFVSSSSIDAPIPAFKLHGKTMTEKIYAKIGKRPMKIISTSPFYAYAVDENGKTLASVGRPPGLKENKEEFEKIYKEKKYDKDKEPERRDQASTPHAAPDHPHVNRL